LFIAVVFAAEKLHHGDTKPVHVINDNLDAVFASESQLLQALGLQADENVKVVSVIGATKQGKSHLLNHVFFNGEEVFETSNSVCCCLLLLVAYMCHLTTIPILLLWKYLSKTCGAWAVVHKNKATNEKIIIIDTEGLFGTQFGKRVISDEQRKFMLYRVMCMSNVVIFNRRGAVIDQADLALLENGDVALEQGYSNRK